MKFNTLGDTELEVSQIALGTMTFGEQNSEAEGHEQLDYALENGINFIDTAELYAIPSTKENNGATERIIGTWLKKTNARDKIVLASKVTGPREDISYISENLGYSPQRMKEALEGSLKRLQTDYLDLYQIHWPERNANFFGKRGYVHDEDEEWLYNFHTVVEQMDTFKKEGKIRHWGLSNETPWGVMKYILESDLAWKARPVSVQNPYSLLNRTYEVGMAEISMRERIGLLSYSPLAFGRLTGKYLNGEDDKKSRIYKYRALKRYNSDRAKLATKAYYEIAENHGLSLAQMSLAYVHSRPFNTSTIIGATKISQLKENIESVDIVLSEEILSEIEEVQNIIPNPAP